jgi:prepilin-type N-terminal cleavage/methylation domain-containing protein
MKNQKGFTLVEMAIVLVIIGLLLGGVLKGQELIDNSKIKNAVNDLKGVSAASSGYYDRFHQLPGDDGPLATLKARSAVWANITLAGNLDGTIGDVGANPFNTTAENVAFWQHIRAAGFVSGDPSLATAATALPKNAFGGLTGVTRTGVTGQTSASAYVCMSAIPGKAALAMDIAMDDGLSNSGTMWATSSTAVDTTLAPGAAAAAYTEGTFYTVCTGL